jgi:homoserine acetyltransferase
MLVISNLVTVIGASMGAMQATPYATSYPEAIDNILARPRASTPTISDPICAHALPFFDRFAFLSKPGLREIHTRT